MKPGLVAACLVAISLGACATAPVEMADLAAPKGKVFQVGSASYYKSGARTANGERFLPHGMTAAHPSLRFGTKVAVRNLANGQSVVVRINDRGPFVRGRIIDVALGAARRIGMIASGHAKVELAIVD